MSYIGETLYSRGDLDTFARKLLTQGRGPGAKLRRWWVAIPDATSTGQADIVVAYGTSAKDEQYLRAPLAKLHITI